MKPEAGSQRPEDGRRSAASVVPASVLRPPSSGFADLHLHTIFSDGTYTPEELTGRAQQLGLAALALTDHDTVEGCARMNAACQQAGLEFIPATELTAEFDDNELHLLGYFVDTQNPRLLAEMAKFQKVRQERIHEMVARLNQLDIPLQADAVFAIANCRSPGRPPNKPRCAAARWSRAAINRPRPMPSAPRPTCAWRTPRSKRRSAASSTRVPCGWARS